MIIFLEIGLLIHAYNWFIDTLIDNTEKDKINAWGMFKDLKYYFYEYKYLFYCILYYYTILLIMYDPNPISLELKRVYLYLNFISGTYFVLCYIALEGCFGIIDKLNLLRKQLIKKNNDLLNQEE